MPGLGYLDYKNLETACYHMMEINNKNTQDYSRESFKKAYLEMYGEDAYKSLMDYVSSQIEIYKLLAMKMNEAAIRL